MLRRLIFLIGLSSVTYCSSEPPVLTADFGEVFEGDVTSFKGAMLIMKQSFVGQKLLQRLTDLTRKYKEKFRDANIIIKLGQEAGIVINSVSTSPMLPKKGPTQGQ